MTALVRWIVSITLALSVLQRGMAQEPTLSVNEAERSAITFGVFVTDRQSTTRLNSDRGDGTNIDLEDDLGLESSQSVGRLGAHWWLDEAQRHRLDVGVFDLSRTASTQLTKDIEFGDSVFPVDEMVSSDSDLTIYKVDYTFSVIRRERGFFGVVGGLYVADEQLRISGLGTPRESRNLTAPLPVVGLRGEYRIADRATLRAAAQWFFYNSDSFDGSMSDLYAGVDYALSKRFGLGLAYNKVDMDVEYRKRSLVGRLDFSYDGFLLYLKYSFLRH